LGGGGGGGVFLGALFAPLMLPRERKENHFMARVGGGGKRKDTDPYIRFANASSSCLGKKKKEKKKGGRRQPFSLSSAAGREKESGCYIHSRKLLHSLTSTVYPAHIRHKERKGKGGKSQHYRCDLMKGGERGRAEGYSGTQKQSRVAGALLIAYCAFQRGGEEKKGGKG